MSHLCVNTLPVKDVWNCASVSPYALNSGILTFIRALCIEHDSAKCMRSKVFVRNVKLSMARTHQKQYVPK